jgi:ATP-GRASP peptide maturase of grasp-with-spasm system
MILLLSSSNDVNLDHVVDWLRLYGHPFLRINSDDVLEEDFHLSLSPPSLVVRQQKVSLQDVGSVWLRKWGNFRRTGWFKQAERRLDAERLMQLSREFSVTLTALTVLLKDKHWLTHPSRVHVNKLEMLDQAQAAGLTIPETHLINRKARLEQLLRQGEFITKSSFEPMFLKQPDGFYSMFTQLLTAGDVDGFDETFFPSLVQRKVDKAYELRVFYLDGELYTMAIFSQRTERTALDFRDYDWSDPNRCVPYQLPEDVTQAVQRFMRAVGLNCASLDMIKGRDGDYYFLEVNPTGQFGMTAFPCNYPLYEKIAQYLIAHDRPQEEAAG